MGLLLARGWSERRARDMILALGQHAQATSVEDPAHVALGPVHVDLAGHEDVRDGEGGIERELRRVAAVSPLLLPDRARDVDQGAAAVPFAVHVAGAMKHLLKRDEAVL